MNEIFYRFLLGGDKITPKMLLRQPEFTAVHEENSVKPKKECKNLGKLETQDIFFKRNYIKPALEMIWLLRRW